MVWFVFVSRNLWFVNCFCMLLIVFLMLFNILVICWYWVVRELCCFVGIELGFIKVFFMCIKCDFKLWSLFCMFLFFCIIVVIWDISWEIVDFSCFIIVIFFFRGFILLIKNLSWFFRWSIKEGRRLRWKIIKFLLCWCFLLCFIFWNNRRGFF